MMLNITAVLEIAIWLIGRNDPLCSKNLGAKQKVQFLTSEVTWLLETKRSHNLQAVWATEIHSKSFTQRWNVETQHAWDLRGESKVWYERPRWSIYMTGKVEMARKAKLVPVPYLHLQPWGFKPTRPGHMQAGLTGQDKPPCRPSHPASTAVHSPDSHIHVHIALYWNIPSAV